jgi:NAD(P)-dependent dehydrogenase (short-subunit alcohol dehydrogenase family)
MDCCAVSDKQILITGATNGIGLAAAEALVALGANLVIVGRSQTRTRMASARIRAASAKGATVATFIAALSSQDSVRRLAAEVVARYPKLDVLINNAGAMYGTRQLTKDGIELTWAVNHLAPFLLSKLLLNRLKESAPARIITTASQAHQGAHIPFDDLNVERSYRGFGRYCETKLANILFTTELARRLDGTGVTANCFHPGLVATGFNRNNGLLMNLGMTILRTVDHVAQRERPRGAVAARIRELARRQLGREHALQFGLHLRDALVLRHRVALGPPRDPIRKAEHHVDCNQQPQVARRRGEVLPRAARLEDRRAVRHGRFATLAVLEFSSVLDRGHAHFRLRAAPVRSKTRNIRSRPVGWAP